MTELPSGWTQAPLGVLASDISYGFTAKARAVGGDAQMLRITDIQHGTVDWSSVPFCDISAQALGGYRLQDGDLLFARTGATVGKTYLVRCVPARVVFASYLIRVRPTKKGLSNYLSHFFGSHLYWRQITDFSAGIGQPNVNGSKLREILVPVAPEPEQQRIADKLDTVLARVDACRDRLARVAPLLKRFRQSVLAASMSGQLTEDWRNESCLHVDPNWFEELSSKQTTGDRPRRVRAITPAKRDLPVGPQLPSGWVRVDFDAIAAQKPHALKAGPFGSALKKSMYVSAGYKIYGQEQVIAGDEALGDYYIDREKFEKLQSCAVEPNDILISLVGTIGRVLVLSANAVPGIINPRLVKLSLQPWVNRTYVSLYLKSPLAKRYFANVSHGGTMEILNLSTLRTLPLLLPPPQEQTEIVRRVETLFAYADRLEARLAQAQTAVDRLTPSLLAKAFRGELVPQDPADEPAAELLERLAANRTAPVPKTRMPRQGQAA